MHIIGSKKGEEMLKEVLQNELKELERIEKNSKKFLSEAPEGSLYTITNKNTSQYYWKKDKYDKHGKYISKKNDELIRALAQKEYETQVLKSVTKNKRYIQKILDSYMFDGVTKVYENLSTSKKEKIEAYSLPEKEFAERWSFEQQALKERLQTKISNKYEFDEDSELTTDKGEPVRSKSEKIIADKLNKKGVPYVYEQPLLFNGYCYIVPDFKVLNRKTRKEIYWEHLGMMDDADYVEKAIKKIELYEKNGIFQGDKLIVTYETKEHPLNVKHVDKMIGQYFE